jgi:hypothetical protein
MSDWHDKTYDLIASRLNHLLVNQSKDLLLKVSIKLIPFQMPGDRFVRVQISENERIIVAIDYYKSDDNETRLVQLLMVVQAYLHWHPIREVR